MERHEAWQIFIETRDNVYAEIAVIIDTDVSYHRSTIALNNAIDRLHEALSQFGHPVAEADDFEDITTPLFDACSYLTEARSLCRGNGVRALIVQKIRRLAEHAREELEEAISAEIPY